MATPAIPVVGFVPDGKAAASARYAAALDDPRPQRHAISIFEIAPSGLLADAEAARSRRKAERHGSVARDSTGFFLRAPGRVAVGNELRSSQVMSSVALSALLRISLGRTPEISAAERSDLGCCSERTPVVLVEYGSVAAAHPYAYLC
jgi:hypothetical protein